MPPQIAIRAFAVVAKNVDHAGHVRRHRLQRNAQGNRGPRRRHLFGRLGRFLAHGTPRVVRREFLEAVPVDRVPARHFVRGKSAAEQVFLTDRAVAHVLARLAVVIVKQKCVNAHAAVVAVFEVFATADAAKAAVFAMVGRLLVGHPQVANVAVVLTKLYAAIDAVVAVEAVMQTQQ